MGSDSLDAVIDDVVNAERAVETDDDEPTGDTAEDANEDDADPDPRSHIDPPARDLPLGEAAPAPHAGPLMAFRPISQLLGIPLFYERPPVGPPAKPHSFSGRPGVCPDPGADVARATAAGACR